MKIAIDIRSAGGEKAGKGWYTFHIVQNLLKLDHENEYLLYAKDGVPGFEGFKNAKVKLLSGPGIFWHRNVAKDIVRENIDLFFAPSSFIIPAILPKAIKTILTVHDLVAFLFPNKHNRKATIVEKLFLKRALKRSDFVVTVSDNTRRDLIGRFEFDPKKVKTVYCAAGDEFKPIDREKLSDFAAKTNLPNNFFLAVGTLEPRKNYLNLIRSFAIIHEIFPKIHLVIVGQEGWDFEEIHLEIHKNYLNKYVHLLGYLSGKSLVNLYNLTEALVFPSLYEGFGIPPLEAMKCGCPVVASDRASIPEVVGNAAILVDPEDGSELSAAMVKLLREPDLRSRLSAMGLEQSKKFSWEASAKKLLDVIKTA